MSKSEIKFVYNLKSKDNFVSYFLSTKDGKQITNMAVILQLPNKKQKKYFTFHCFTKYLMLLE